MYYVYTNEYEEEIGKYVVELYQIVEDEGTAQGIVDTLLNRYGIGAFWEKK